MAVKKRQEPPVPRELLCIQCQKLPPERLAKLGEHEAYFCSAACGALWALTTIEATWPPLYVWCAIHRRWSECGNLCPECGTAAGTRG